MIFYGVLDELGKMRFRENLSIGKEELMPVVDVFKIVLASDKQFLSTITNPELLKFITSERIFYVFGVHNQNDRGKHSHFKTKQVLICLNGEVSVLCKDGNKERTWVLNKPNQALYIPELIWDEQVYIKPDSVLLVLANTNYDESDYITDYNKFKRLKNENK